MQSRILTRASRGLLPLMTLAAMTFTAQAQKRFDTQYRADVEPYISIFEHCDYRGKRRDIAVGDFRRMRDLDFGNDSISSIKVPRELKVIIFEHDDYKGVYAEVDRNVRCFDRNWDDQVSSLKVQYSEPGYRPDGNIGSSRPNHKDGVTGNNVARVVFDEGVLQKVDKRTWELRRGNRRSVEYYQTRNDESSVYLVNEYTAERIRIDLFTNEVTLVRDDGQQQRYYITQRRAKLNANRPKPTKKPTKKPTHKPAAVPKTRIVNSCFNYHAYTKGKTGGIRFYGKGGFHTFKKRGHKGRICHNGELNMEINKRDFDADVTVNIDGRIFRFASGEKEDRLLNTWYRKGIKLQVGKY